MNSLRQVAWALWVPLTALAVWQVLATYGVLNSLFFPRPTEIVRIGAEMAVNGELYVALQSTLQNILIGYVLGCSAGLACGVAMGRYAAVRRSLETVIAALYSTPKLSLFPLLLLLFGVNDVPRILITAIACFIVLAFHGQDAVDAVGRTYPEVAAVYGATPSMLVRKVYIPAALPTLFTGLRLAVGRAMVVAISVEMVSSNQGLSGLIWLSWQSFAVEKLFVGVAIAGLLGAFFHVSLRWLEKRLIPWKTVAAG
ncbi:MAG: ABC transporter permease [Acidobacteria bacterium]|nr:ABC transporter permease [Acidobacteriota bacterium]